MTLITLLFISPSKSSAFIVDTDDSTKMSDDIPLVDPKLLSATKDSVVVETSFFSLSIEFFPHAISYITFKYRFDTVNGFFYIIKHPIGFIDSHKQRSINI